MNEQRYYTEPDREKRKELLDAAIAEEGVTAELVFMRRLYNFRYARRKGDRTDVDYLMRAWMELSYLGRTSGSFFGSSLRKKLTKVHETLGGLLAAEAGETGRTLWQRELTHLLRLYIRLCREDRSYTTTLFGLMHIKEEQVADKLEKELMDNAFRLPAAAGMEQAFAELMRAARTAFLEAYPNRTAAFDGADP